MRLRQLFEAAPAATAVMAFGRMNPPTIGHAKLVEAVKSQSGDPYIFLSQSQKPKTDPLSFNDKLRYAKFFFPEVTIGSPEVKTVIQALQKLNELGYENLIYVAGSDRVQAFEELINKYNGQADKAGNVPYNFKSISVVSAGERDPDADGAEGMSASKMRQAAADNDLESFKQGVPQPQLADEMFAAVRQGMGIADTVEEDDTATSLRPRLRPDSVTTDEPESDLAPASSPRPRLRPDFKPNRHERLIIGNGKARGMGDDEIAAMLAQIKVETGDFQYMTELGDNDYFKKYDPQYAPRKAAALGNTEPGDGYKYRGRGYLQITGRYNYAQASKSMPGGYTDFIESPDLVANPAIAVQLAFEYWGRRTAPKVSNWNDVRSVTKTINPGLRHLSQREEAYTNYKSELTRLA